LAACAVCLFAARVEAGYFCKHCGCQRDCRKVCRFVCETKEEAKTEYTCECEDFCLPGASKKCGLYFQRDCNGVHRKVIWQPTCAKVHTRKKLVKKQTKKEVPNYKWVVEEYCCVCGQWVKTDRDDDDGKSDDGDSKKSSSKSGGSEQGGKSGYSAAAGEGNPPKLERLPPPAAPGDRQVTADPSVETDYAYYLGANPGYSKESPPARKWVAELEEHSEAAEVSIDDSDREPRRLFLGLFGR
jgi:hypothetical protein